MSGFFYEVNMEVSNLLFWINHYILPAEHQASIHSSQYDDFHWDNSFYGRISYFCWSFFGSVERSKLVADTFLL